jgi:hypothetical protein
MPCLKTRNKGHCNFFQKIRKGIITDITLVIKQISWLKL